ncbi:hypothetical protein [Microcoleus sp. Pol17_C1]|uniref:hypothetical protein n=1 Tax=unclassified Microcoleus TaxID=2642155 RepID=UPI00403F67C9
MRASLKSRLWKRQRGKWSVTPRLTAEFFSIGDLELALVKKVGDGAIARIKMRVQVRSTLWKYNRGKLDVILPQTVEILSQSGLVPCEI